MVSIDNAPTIIGPSYVSELVGHKRVLVRDVRMMTIEAVGPELADPKVDYDLMCSCRLSRMDLSIKTFVVDRYWNWLGTGKPIRIGTKDGDWHLTHKTRIRSDQFQTF